ncbi:hypothetical protein DFH06DRAFT_1471225 [Mycena polygramma]|nr:hypothetical protein DFH06DRAFT_1471225 [Mycena polygramma]
MAANTQWTYSMSASRGDDLTTIQINSVPQFIAQRGPVKYYNQCPPTPYIQYVPLPPQTSVQLQIPDIFPIDLSRRELPPLQMLSMYEPILPYTTIRVEDVARRGLFKVRTGATAMTYADFVQFLQFLYHSQLPSCASLAPNARLHVGAHFVSRHGSHGQRRWYAFANGAMDLGIPTGEDLLEGKRNLWMLALNQDNALVATVDPLPRQAYQSR